MSILLILLLIVLILATTGFHIFHSWKMKEYRTFIFQTGIVSLSIVGGVVIIQDPHLVSISEWLNALSPLGK
ncbi:hypothetical protein [Bacillus fonticola]|uniref:hypothetical protein n=1 Tax=Bacillus fonticola TaxID=2728853 RepID=UPI001474DE62|nr:hypothetical protein [Bacillus fonticola]